MTLKAARPGAGEELREFVLSEAEFTRLRTLVHQTTGIALADGKQELVYGRLSRRLRALGLQSFGEYCDMVEAGHPEEMEALTNAITTNLTAFFREDHHFRQLTEQVLPEIQVQQAATRRLRVWSAGCSTGEEPYSIAMTLRESFAPLAQWDARILATDIDSNVLARAARGEYSAEAAGKMPPARRTRWFTPTPGGGTFTAADELKSLIAFKQLNLLNDWPMRGPFDVIFCRNVVIYFDKDTQRKLFDRMAALQRPGAWLFIGHSENLFNVSQAYKLVGRTAYRRL